MVGQYATAQELYAGSLAKTKYYPTLVSIRSIISASNDALDNIQMEHTAQGIARAAMYHMTDSQTRPINRMVMAQTIKSGSAIPSYIIERKMKY